MADFDPAKIAVDRPIWEHHKKGELMPEKNFWSKYASFSMSTIRDSYQTAIIGRIKSHHKMEKIRERENGWQEVPPLREGNACGWSDTSSNRSVFKGEGVKILTRGKTSMAKKPNDYMAPAVQEVYDRIDGLIQTDVVQKACKWSDGLIQTDVVQKACK